MGTVHRLARCILAGAVLAMALAVPAAAADDVKVVASGLDNPRGIDFGPGGYLYVAESGRGGSGPCMPGPEGDPVCFGTSGAVTRVKPNGHHQKRIAVGLPSIASPQGTDALGPLGVSWPRRGIKSLGFLTMGLGADPAVRATLPPAGSILDTLQRLHPDGRHRTLADLGAFEAANNPDKDQPDAAEPDSNPNGLYALNNREAIVADSGGNDILSVTRTGEITLLAVLPFGTAPAPAGVPGLPPPGTPIPFQPVPTSVAVGEDGSIYISQLTGFPFPTGGSKIWRIPAGGGTPEEFASGLTLVTDLAFGADGSLYVVEIASATFIGPPTPGALIRIKPDGTKDELAAGQLSESYGLALHGNYAYVTNKATSAGTGEVVRIRLPGDAGEDNGDNGDDD
jgi:hypothetical protein